MHDEKALLISQVTQKDYHDFLTEVEELDFANRTRRMFQKIREITDRKPPRENPISLEEWAAFYENLYSLEPEDSLPTAFRLSESDLFLEDNSELSSDISLEEVESVLKNSAKFSHSKQIHQTLYFSFVVFCKHRTSTGYSVT